MQQLEHMTRTEIGRTRGLMLITPVGVCDVDLCDDVWLGYLCEVLGIDAPLHEDAAAVRRRIYEWNRNEWLGKLARYREAMLARDPTAHRMELS